MHLTLTWRMWKLAQQKQPADIMRAPLMGSCGFAAAGDWTFASALVHGKLMAGPLTRVMIIAPPTVIIVPAIFIWLCSLLVFTSSSLQYNKDWNSWYGSNEYKSPIYLKLYIRCKLMERYPYRYTHKKIIQWNLKIQANKKVRAGSMFVMETANVAVVYFIAA